MQDMLQIQNVLESLLMPQKHSTGLTNVLAGRIQICCNTEYNGVKIRENSAFWHHFLLDCPGVQMFPSSFTLSHPAATSSPPATVLSITPCPKQIPFKEGIPILNSVTFLLFQIIVALSFLPSVFSLRGIFLALIPIPPSFK